MSAELLRYLAAGLCNTLAGYLVFLGVLHGLAWPVALANVISYAVGLLVAYVLNRTFVFRDAAHTPAALAKFLAGFAVAFGVNAAVLYAAHALLHVRAEVAQLAAMAAYTVTFYVINKYVVFASRTALPARADIA